MNKFRKIRIQRTQTIPLVDEKGKESKIKIKPYLVVKINRDIPFNHREFQSCIGGLW